MDYTDKPQDDSLDTGISRRRAILLTCYMTGAENGANLGSPGYSYDFVARLFWPILERWGEVIPVPEPAKMLDATVENLQRANREVVHISFLPFQDVTIARGIPNIVVPAWEFPDIPNEGFAGSIQNDWRIVGNQCARIFVGGDFTRDTFRRGEITVPIDIVPVPTPEEYFEVPDWSRGESTEFGYTVYDPRQNYVSTAEPRKLRPWWQEIGRAIENIVRNNRSLFISDDRWNRWKQPLQSKLDARKIKRKSQQVVNVTLPYPTVSELGSDCVIYSSVFNPADGRKNWKDLLTAFAAALGQYPDAVLLLKLITARPLDALKVVDYYMNRDMPHRCRILFITEFLSHVQMVQLAQWSAFYLQTTKAEGNGLPLMNFLASGRPGVSPSHSAIGDYFDSKWRNIGGWQG